jgi:ATP-binding cassette subfamily B protein
MTNIRYGALLYPLLNSFNAIAVAVALAYGGFLSEKSILPVGLFVTFLTHVQDFLPPIRNILEKYQTFQSSLASAERIFNLLDENPEPVGGKALPAEVVFGHIEFKNVRFAYDNETGDVLKGISFEIKPGQSVAIVGATGSGKSTIINCLQRFYEVKSGDILLDGVPIKDLHPQQLRRRIGVVQQDLFVFSGTLESNISLEDERITSDRVRRAALQAHCEQIITSRGDGLQAPIVERGANLSAGERQLLSFARALAFKPDILVLDEATANVDSQSEYLIQQATREVTKDRTSIIIAHRLSTILNCDQILVMDKGEIVERGTHKELLAKGGAYQRLYSLQFSEQSTH